MGLLQKLSTGNSFYASLSPPGQRAMECMPGGIRMMSSYCWHLIFRCGASYSDSADEDCPLYKGWNSPAKACTQIDSEFQQVTSFSSLSPQGGSLSGAPAECTCMQFHIRFEPRTSLLSHVHLCDFNSTKLDLGDTDPPQRNHATFQSILEVPPRMKEPENDLGPENQHESESCRLQVLPCLQRCVLEQNDD